tara:strand:+ start:241 stop:2136 length:1896 start_codon:yes stop_codon:yes gene_type:complete
MEATPESVSTFLDQYCIQCHGGEKVKGKVDFTTVSVETASKEHFDFWELAAEVVDYEDMPPEDEKQPTAEERAAFQQWYEANYIHVAASPGVFQPRRLSTPEYRNTMRALFGFDLENKVAKSEQTAIEPSLILKLMPTDPPGESGFINDTHAAPLSTVLWDQYAYFSEVALHQLFSPQGHKALKSMLGEELPGKFKHSDFTQKHARQLIEHFAPIANRRPVDQKDINEILTQLEPLSGVKLVDALKFEMKTILMSPGFLYRGMRMKRTPGQQQPVDSYELAERLSYFLWEDMPDQELRQCAADGSLKDPETLSAQVERMLASPKARSLSDSFATQWLVLDEIDDAYSDPYLLDSFKNQPLDFLNYLFTEKRPVIELIDSDVTFASHVTASIYPKDKNKLEKYVKPKGIEKQVVPNQKLALENTEGRGGLLTMPAVLAMNRGPILRGTWTLRKVLGEHLGEPPADVPPIQSTIGDKKLSFREKFEHHRANASCARCHDKIDPLGFAFEGYNDKGAYLLSSNKSPLPKGMQSKDKTPAKIDTSGQLTTGESFQNFEELKALLLTTRREDIVRNAVEQTLSYALCRKLESHDGPAVESITTTLLESDGTWQDLFTGVANSLPFRETIFSSDSES